MKTGGKPAQKQPRSPGAQFPTRSCPGPDAVQLVLFLCDSLSGPQGLLTQPPAPHCAAPIGAGLSEAQCWTTPGPPTLLPAQSRILWDPPPRCSPLWSALLPLPQPRRTGCSVFAATAPASFRCRGSACVCRASSVGAEDGGGQLEDRRCTSTALCFFCPVCRVISTAREQSHPVTSPRIRTLPGSTVRGGWSECPSQQMNGTELRRPPSASEPPWGGGVSLAPSDLASPMTRL